MLITSTGIGTVEGTLLLVALPDLNEEDGPIRGQRVDYINRPSGITAGSGDVLISHVLYSPTDDEIDSNYDELMQSFSGGVYTSFSFTSVVSEHLSEGFIDTYAYRYPRGWKQIIQRNSGSWECSGAIYKRVPGSRLRWWRLSFTDYYFKSRSDAELAFASAYNTACILLNAVTPSYTPPMPSRRFVLDRITNAHDCSVTINQPHLELYKSRLDSFIESRQVYTPRIADSGVKASLFYKAYYDAVDKLPALQQNLLANIVECISTIASFLDGFDASDLRNAKSVAKDLWLQYRYSFKTTINDMKEVTNAVARLESVAGKSVSTYGYATNGEYDVACAISIKLELPDSVSGWLKAINLRPTLVNLWDMVPYSFVVDWFLRIGSILEDLQKWLDAATLKPQSLWYSVWHSIQEPGIDGIEYCRFAGNPPNLPYFSSHKVGSRTIGFRIADSIALFLL
jgi:hypothetical protein